MGAGQEPQYAAPGVAGDLGRRKPSAAIGLVLRQHSSGGKSVLLGISKLEQRDGGLREQEGAHGLGDPAQ